MPDRDYVGAVRERVVVFDGGMGATLEQFDLTPEDYGGPQGKCHEALVLNRPDVIEGVHTSMLDAGAEVVETDTFQGSRLKLEEWGSASTTLEIDTKAAQIARKAAGADRFVAGSIGPTATCPPATTRRSARSPSASSWRSSPSRRRAWSTAAPTCSIIETAQDILEVKAAIFGAREAFKQTGREVPIQTQRLAAAKRRKMLLGTDIQAVLTTLTALDVE